MSAQAHTRTWAAALALGVAASATGCTRSRSETPPNERAKKRPKCDRPLKIQHADSVLAEHMRRGKAHDFQETFEAKPIDRATMSPVEAVESLTVDSRPAFWFTKDAGTVVVDAEIFGTLQTVDAARIDRGETKRVGEIRIDLPHTRAKWRVVELLIRSGVIQTYFQDSASLCVREQTDAGGTYRVEIDGEHRYYTNEENIDPLAFAVTMDEGGGVRVVGRL